MNCVEAQAILSHQDNAECRFGQAVPVSGDVRSICRIRFFPVAGAGNIIHRDIVEPGKDQKAVNGNPCFAAFIICVGSLPDMEQVCNPLLSQGSVLPELAYPFIILHAGHTSVRL